MGDEDRNGRAAKETDCEGRGKLSGEVDGTGSILLTGGRSSRMGSPKALLAWRGSTFVQHGVELLRRHGPVWVVTNPDLAPSLEVLLADPLPATRGSQAPSRPGREPPVGESSLPRDQAPVTLLINPRPEDGLFSSVRLAAQELPPTVRRFFVMPVDCILPDDGVLCRLAADATCGERSTGPQEQPQVFFPTFYGRRGHPVLLCRLGVAFLLSQAPTDIFSQVLAGLPGQEVAVDEPWILLNVNTPADYNRLLREDAARRSSK